MGGPKGKGKNEAATGATRKGRDRAAAPSAALKEPWQMTKREFTDVLSSGKVADRVMAQTEGRVQSAAIRERVTGEGRYFRKERVPLDRISVFNEAQVDPRRATPSKGAIVIDGKFDVIDGRHRVAHARARGETHITAYRPVKRVESHKKVIKAALAAGKPVPKNVLKDYPGLKGK